MHRVAIASDNCKILQPDWLVIDADRVLPGAALAIRRGRVEAILEGNLAIQGAEQAYGVQRERLANAALAPGWVNAHAHLELSHLAHRVAGAGGFPAWVLRLVASKEQTPTSQWERSVALGAERLLATGTTCVADIDSIGALSGDRGALPIRSRVYREVLDLFQPGRFEAARAALLPPSVAHPRRSHGIAPHASFSVSPGLWQHVVLHRRQWNLPLTLHWSETREEVRWLRHGDGPLKDWLGQSPKRSGLELVASLGALDRSLSLVHGNFPAPGEIEAIARAGAKVVHCPASHRFFDREPFPLHAYRKGGVEVALGTDSWASNQDLHMGYEVQLLRQQFAWLDAPSAYRMATEAGANALGLTGQVGRLAAGHWADMVLVPLEATSAGEVLEQLTRDAIVPTKVWVGGVPVLRNSP